MHSFPEDRYIKIGPYNVRYWTAGDAGPAVLLVHGLGGSIENWSRNLGPLAAGRRVYAMDLPGFGRTDKTPLVGSLYELVDFIRDFMDALGIEGASLIGNSLGGGLILEFAARYPERTDKVVLVGSAGLGREVLRDLRVCAVPLLGEWFTRPSRDTTASLWRKIVADPALITDELVATSYDLYRLPGARKALLKTLRAGINILGQRKKLLRELWAGMRTLPAPVLVVWGRQDRIIPLKHAEVAARLLPRAEVYVFDECGHMPQLEHPDEFNELVRRFLMS
jgi:pimeloyl-ACP methyl ester carboxylesterase